MTSPHTSSRNWLVFTTARVLWVGLTLILVTIFMAGLVPRYNELTTLCAVEPCLPLILSAQDAAALQELGLTIHAYATFQVAIEFFLGGTIALLATLIFWRKSDEWLGLLASFALILFGLNFMVESDVAFIRLYPAWKGIFDAVTALASVPFIILFYLFPDGRFVPGWTRWPAITLIVTAFLDPLLQSAGFRIPSGQFSQILMWVYIVCLATGIYAQVYRYRQVSTPTEKQQTKWIVMSFVGTIVGMICYSYIFEIAPREPGYARVVTNIGFMSVAFPILLLLPLSMVISILRYRLWDIDLVIRRTLKYVLLTGLLALVYFGTVVVLQNLFVGLTGQNSQVVIVISTLAIAALFNPLRGRVQDFIDRRFYRRKYDAAQTLAQFAQTARDEVEIETLTEELIRVVRETMQPDQISVWVRKSDLNR